jgi:hypothetical protein
LTPKKLSEQQSAKARGKLATSAMMTQEQLCSFALM